jgi:hypothetical protein
VYHLNKLKSFFPEDIEIYDSVKFKFDVLCKELLNNNDINFKEKSIVILFYLFPNLYKYLA